MQILQNFGLTLDIAWENKDEKMADPRFCLLSTSYAETIKKKKKKKTTKDK